MLFRSLYWHCAQPVPRICRHCRLVVVHRCVRGRNRSFGRAVHRPWTKRSGTLAGLECQPIDALCGLPQAFKRVLPPLAGQFISLVKDTSLVSVIAITELLKSGREVITTSFSPFEILFCVAGLYLLINLPLSHLASRLERRLAHTGLRSGHRSATGPASCPDSR